MFAVTNKDSHVVVKYWFLGSGGAPSALPEGFQAFAGTGDNGPPAPPDWNAAGWTLWGSENSASNSYSPVVDYEEHTELVPNSFSWFMKPIVKLKSGSNALVALRRHEDAAAVSVFDSSGALLAEEQVSLSSDVCAEWVLLGDGFAGEIGELRFWEGVRRENSDLLARREYTSPLTDGLGFYLRTINEHANPSVLADETADGIYWKVSGGKWTEAHESGIAIDFVDEGLKRIDRGTVKELASLASIVPQIQKKVDQVDAGLNPLGLAEGAIPFDLDARGEDDAKSHFEQIRERAGTALANARKALENAQKNASNLFLLQESQNAHENMLETAELDFKNRLIEYFGYPYAGDIGPSGTYPQGYDGPDVYHYAWMEPALYAVDAVSNTVAMTITTKTKPDIVKVFVPFMSASETSATNTLTFALSANGLVVKPSNISGKRRAQGKIQDALTEFIGAYSSFLGKMDTCKSRLDDFESAVSTTANIKAPLILVKFVCTEAGAIAGYVSAGTKAALNCAINTLEMVNDIGDEAVEATLNSVPGIQGAGMTVNIDPRALAGAAMSTIKTSQEATYQASLLSAKNAIAVMEAGQSWTTLTKELIMGGAEYALDRVENYTQLRDAWYEYNSARAEMVEAYRALLASQASVETLVAEAERIIDERTLKRTQAVDSLTKMRYNEMFFRIERDNALSRYSATFDLAQKYAYLAARAYDYETGLLSSDPRSGDRFVAEIVGARALGEFDDDGEPVVSSGDGDGGLADILARLDANWLVLKPRLGINNPQGYATWFSLRHELFRIYPDKRGDRQWKTALQKRVVADLNALPEFRHYCQPLAGSTAAKEPGIVIEFPSQIVYGYNFFGEESAGGDSPLDPTWYATHIAAAGVHFEGYDDSALTKTPTAYLVPVGEDRMRSVGDPETVISWKVVDQTIPAPYEIGSTQLDDPDWTPLYDGATGGNDLGARIRRHPSFRAYYDDAGKEPKDDELDCTRLVGRSAWNTRWLLIIPSGAMNSSRDDAVEAFVNSVSDIKLGLKTYSASGN